MTTEAYNKFLGKLLLCLVAFLLGAVAGIASGERASRQEAITRGHAEWIADKDGSAVFKWKERP